MSDSAETPDHYDVLGVDPDADTKAIRVAYSAAIWAARAADDEERERSLKLALAVLSDPERRAGYDQQVSRERGPSVSPHRDPALAALLATLAEFGHLPSERESDAIEDESVVVAEHHAALMRELHDSSGAVADESEPESDEQEQAEREEDEDRDAPELQDDSRAASWGLTAGRAATLPRRRGRWVAVLALLISGVAGAAVGWFLLGPEPSSVFGEDACVAIEGDAASAVACDDDRAVARIAGVTDDPATCTGDAGHLMLPERRFGCLTLLEDAVAPTPTD